jgi:GNAT superfamily N-acetyltransferase
MIVRPYEVGDREALGDLLRAVWPHKSDIAGAFDARWWWRHAAPPIVLADEGGRLLGLAAYMAFRLWTDGAELPAAWFVDFYVRPDAKGRGVGRALARDVMSRFPVVASLSQTEAAYRVFHKLGWSARASAPILMRPLALRLPVGFQTPSVTLETVAVADAPRDALDALWVRARARHGALACRDAAALAERYAPSSSRTYALHLCRTDGALAGYAVTRATHAAARRDVWVVDYLTRPGVPRVLAALVGHAEAAARRDGASRLSIMTTDAADQRTLGARGFLSPRTPILGRRLAGQEKWLTFHAAGAAPAIDPAGWYVTLGDCDLDLS